MYHVIGRLIVERGESGYYEVLHVMSTSDAVLYPDTDQDLEDLIFNSDLIPMEPGIYAFMCAATIDTYQDYQGDWDASAKIKWSCVTKLNEEESEAVLEKLLP